MAHNRRKLEPLSKCEQIRPDALIRAITLRQDERLMHCFVDGFDAVASDVVYHRSCYKQFTNPTSLQYLEDSPTDQHEIYATAFQKLCNEVED